MSCKPTSRCQRGITLLISLVMLVILTLFALTAMRLSNINLKITGNYQRQEEMEMLTDSALEQIVSSASNFEDSAVQAGTALDYDICNNGTVVASGGCTIIINPKIGTITTPRCIASGPAKGYTKKLGELAPDDDDWVLHATLTDSLSGTVMKISRGVTVRMLAGHCPE